MENKDYQNRGRLISFILRLSIAILFAEAAYIKFASGSSETVAFFKSTFAGTWLPQDLIVLYARIIPFVEVIIPIWLLVGYKLKWAWTFTAFVLISLAFGMEVAGEYSTTADNFFYVFICCIGIYFADCNRTSSDGNKNK